MMDPRDRVDALWGAQRDEAGLQELLFEKHAEELEELISEGMSELDAKELLLDRYLWS